MKIHSPTNKLLCDLLVNENSYRYRKIAGEHTLTLYFSLPEYIDIPVGSYCDFQAERYTLERPENFKKNGEENFEYTLIMDAPQARLGKYKVRHDGRLKFQYTAKPHEHLELIIRNLNEKEPGWSKGECIDGVERPIEYNHIFCDDALQMLAGEFETEWEIDGKRISLHKAEYYKDNPLQLSYGKDKGLVPGLGRQNFENSRPIERLYIQGGEKNIDYSVYQSKELLLPVNSTLDYEGRTYESSGDGRFITCRGQSNYGNEDSLDCSHIYPKFLEKVGEVEVTESGKYYFTLHGTEDAPNTIDFTEYQIEGEVMTVIFQEGMLAGKEFDVEYEASENRFRLFSQSIDGINMPNETFSPAPGQTFAIYGCMPPMEYICDNSAQSGASWEMFREAARYLHENLAQKYSYTCEIDGIAVKRQWVTTGGKIRPGSYVQLNDPQFLPGGELIRMIGIKEYVHKPDSPVIELSNMTMGSPITNDLNKIDSNEVASDNNYESALAFTKRRFRDAKETLEMLADALLNFSEGINPITVQTMAVLVGDESLQFRFVDSRTDPQEIAHNVSYDIENKELNVPEGILQHMTLDIRSISSSHTLYRFWDMAPMLNDKRPGIDPKAKFYLYARVERHTDFGEYYLSEKAVKMDEDPNYYYLLMGVLNSEYEGERSYVSLYGFTEILPGRITTDRVISSDGENYMDFVNNAVRIGNDKNYIDFNSQKDGVLRLKGSLIQSESGEESFLGVFRGAYNETYTYYPGDEVTYAMEGTKYSLYKRIGTEPCTSYAPTDTRYWSVIAAAGVNGDWVSYVFRQSFYQPAKPQGEEPIPAGWLDAPSSTGRWWMSKATINGETDLAMEEWSTPVQVTAEDGQEGPYTDFKYRVNDSTDTAPSISVSTRYPTGWEDTPPELKEGEYLWMTQAVIDANNNLKGVWSTPVRISGEKGEDGIPGDYYEYRYKESGSPKEAPHLDREEDEPEGWSTILPEQRDKFYVWCTVAKKNSEGKLLQNTLWGVPVRITGADGEQGQPGASPVYSGDYKAGAIYYGTAQRVDIVKYNDLYYIARADAGELYVKDGSPGGVADTGAFRNILPTDTRYWNTFGAQFESIATNLLLSKEANIANFIFRNERMESRTPTGGTPNIILDGINNLASFAAGQVTFDHRLAKIGLFEISNGDLIGKDTEGNTRIWITKNELLANNKMVDGDIQKLGIRDFQGMSYTTNKSTTDCFIDWEDYDNSVYHWNKIIWFDDIYDFENEGAGYGTVKIPFHVPTSGYVQAEIEISSSTNVQGEVFCRTYTSTGASREDPRTRQYLDKGDYYFELFFRYDHSFPTYGRFGLTVKAIIKQVTLEPGVVCTIIGTDGIISRWGGNKFFRFDNKDGMLVRMGSYGLRLTTNGIQKTANNGSSWTNL